MDEFVALDFDGEERWFRPDNRTLALEMRILGEVNPNIEARIGGNRFIGTEQNSRLADIHDLRLQPLGHRTFAEVKWNCQREPLRTI